jgi:hypothetical protein
MKPILVFICLILIIHGISYSQESTSKTKASPGSKQITGESDVSTNNPEIKDGYCVSFYTIPKTAKVVSIMDWIRFEGYYKNGKKDSVWTYYTDPNIHPAHYYIRKEFYKNGIKSGIWLTRNSLDKNVIERYDYTLNSKADPVIEDDLVYPAYAKEKNIQGLVELKILYSSDCSIKNIEFISNPDSCLTDAVVRYVKKKAEMMKKYSTCKDCTGKTETFRKNFILK